MSSDILKNKGIKITKQRKQIIDFLYSNDKVTFKDIVCSNTNIDQSTIYRIIELFLEKQIISKINNNQTTYYVLNDNHKHYIECVLCHDLTEIDICPYNLIDLKGYKIKNDVTIKGICKCCQELKIGIFVGSFNPPTKAHFEIGHLLINKKIIDNIVYLPVNNLEKDNNISLFDRYNMLLNYTKMYPSFLVNNLKLNDSNTNFTWNDLEKLKKDYTSTLYIIIGADNFLHFDNWDNYLYILENYYLIIVNRSNIDMNSLIKDKYAKYKNKIIVIDYNNNTSSTIVREMIKNNIDIKKQVPKEVLDYINTNHLYK